MIEFLINEFTAIDELADLAKLWPNVCRYLEETLGWLMLASGTMSLIITLIIIILPGIILSLILKTIWNKLKNL